LDQQAPRGGKFIQFVPNPAKVGRTKARELSVNGNSTRLELWFGRRRAPDVNSFAFSDQTSCDEMGVIAHTTGLWRILTRDYVPLSHCARLLGFSTPTPFALTPQTSQVGDKDCAPLHFSDYLQLDALTPSPETSQWQSTRACDQVRAPFSVSNIDLTYEACLIPPK
jgi:hypothetical protein